MDVGTWLARLGLSRYEQVFRDNDVDDTVLPSLTAEDLTDLGVTAVGHRRKLLNAIGELRDAGSPPGGAVLPGGTAGSPERVGEPLRSPGPVPGRPAEELPRVRSPEAERRQLTVLFCDLVGSTALSTTLDPEDYREVIGGFHHRAAAVVAALEGHVAQYLGDGVLAYFGYPHAHENEAERAVLAGLELVETVPALRPHAEPRLQVRVGIATGLAVVGDLLAEGTREGESAVGETPNLAARLQGLAVPGTVVVGDRTRQLLGGLFEFADLGTHPAKGFADGVRAWQVLRPGSAEGRFDALHAGQLSPLLGREHELGLLLDRWDQAREGEGQVVLLSGEPGIGKSRMVRALRSVAQRPVGGRRLCAVRPGAGGCPPLRRAPARGPRALRRRALLALARVDPGRPRVRRPGGAGDPPDARGDLTGGYARRAAGPARRSRQPAPGRLVGVPDRR